MGTLAEGAANVVKTCMGVGGSDRVLIVTDTVTKEVAHAIHDTARSMAAESRICVIEDYASRPLRQLPAEVAELIPHATVTFWTAQMHEGELKPRSTFIIEAVKHARHAHMPGITREIMEQGMCADYNSVYSATMRVYEIVKNVKTIHVSSSDGTSLDLKLKKDWRWIPSHGILREKGKWGNLPDGEVFTAPYNVNGTIVVSELGDWFAGRYGHLRDKVRMEIKDSRMDLESIRCGNENLRTELLRYLSTDENSSRASEFAIPTNLYLMERPLIGNMLQDEKTRVHIAFGDPYGWQTNANWKSGTHIDCILDETCGLAADGLEIMRSGKLLVTDGS